MGSKNKTVSFRVDEDSFEALREIAEQRDISLSAVFRDYVDELVTHDGQVRVVPEDEAADEAVTLPATVEVPSSFVRDHERLELEAEHLREQLDEHKEYIAHLQARLEEGEDGIEDVVALEDLDAERRDDKRGYADYESVRERVRERGESDEPYRLG